MNSRFDFSPSGSGNEKSGIVSSCAPMERNGVQGVIKQQRPIQSKPLRPTTTGLNRKLKSIMLCQRGLKGSFVAPLRKV